MHATGGAELHEYDVLIASALRTEGSHLAIGRGGFTLYYARGAHLGGHDCRAIKARCISAGVPVIDSRTAPFEVVARLAVSGPMVAVGEKPSLPPYHALSYAPLLVVAEAYRAAGAEILNLAGLSNVRDRE